MINYVKKLLKKEQNKKIQSMERLNSTQNWTISVELQI